MQHSWHVRPQRTRTMSIQSRHARSSFALESSKYLRFRVTGNHTQIAHVYCKCLQVMALLVQKARVILLRGKHKVFNANAPVETLAHFALQSLELLQSMPSLYALHFRSQSMSFSDSVCNKQQKQNNGVSADTAHGATQLVLSTFRV